MQSRDLEDVLKAYKRKYACVLAEETDANEDFLFDVFYGKIGNIKNGIKGIGKGRAVTLSNIIYTPTTRINEAIEVFVDNIAALLLPYENGIQGINIFNRIKKSKERRSHISLKNSEEDRNNNHNDGYKKDCSDGFCIPYLEGTIENAEGKLYIVEDICLFFYDPLTSEVFFESDEPIEKKFFRKAFVQERYINDVWKVTPNLNIIYTELTGKDYIPNRPELKVILGEKDR
ncbi:MAG: hypothetical protein N3D84_03245 [Candidatus Woesearchaeota archaeon]|nr:hypothetical protein [Candidatus Woesearchaeota archaeon]